MKRVNYHEQMYNKPQKRRRTTNTIEKIEASTTPRYVARWTDEFNREYDWNEYYLRVTRQCRVYLLADISAIVLEYLYVQPIQEYKLNIPQSTPARRYVSPVDASLFFCQGKDTSIICQVKNPWTTPQIRHRAKRAAGIKFPGEAFSSCHRCDLFGNNIWNEGHPDHMHPLLSDNAEWDRLSRILSLGREYGSLRCVCSSDGQICVCWLYSNATKLFVLKRKPIIHVIATLYVNHLVRDQYEIQEDDNVHCDWLEDEQRGIVILSPERSPLGGISVYCWEISSYGQVAPRIKCKIECGNEELDRQWSHPMVSILDRILYLSYRLRGVRHGHITAVPIPSWFCF